jgi:hypothetical protein
MRTPQEARALAANIRSNSAKQFLDKAAQEKKQRAGMAEDFSAIGDMITMVANDQQGEASVLVNDLLGARVSDALQTHKQSIAQTLFAPSADALAEEIVQEEHESVEDFKKRGGKVKQIPAHKSYSASKSQKIKVPFRMGKSAMREEAEQLDETPTRKHFQQVADVIKSHPDAAKRKELAAHHAGIFKAQNPRFDHTRFYAAANAGEPGV